MEASELSKKKKTKQRMPMSLSLHNSLPSPLAVYLASSSEVQSFYHLPLCTDLGGFSGFIFKSHHLEVCTAHVMPENCKSVSVLVKTAMFFAATLKNKTARTQAKCK